MTELNVITNLIYLLDAYAQTDMYNKSKSEFDQMIRTLQEIEADKSPIIIDDVVGKVKAWVDNKYYYELWTMDECLTELLKSIKLSVKIA